METNRVYFSIFYYCIFAKVLGFFPMTYSVKGRILKTKKLDVFITVAVFLIYILIFIRIFYWIPEESTKNFFFVIWEYIVLFGYISFTIQNIYQLSQRQKMKEFFELIEKCDKEFQKLNIKIDYKKDHVNINIVCFLSQIISIFFFATVFAHSTQYSSITGSFNFVGIYTIFYIHIQFFFMQVYVVSLLIRERINTLNKFLR
jgi:7tm Chemosensory receptor